MTNRITFLFLIFLCLSLQVKSQILCTDDFNISNLEQQKVYNLSENIDAYTFTDSLMKLANLPMNFVLMKIKKANNAFAYLDSFGIRYIYYDEKFLGALNSDSTKIESTTVLAHEIGHHLAGHTLFLESFFDKDPCVEWTNKRSSKYDYSKVKNECGKYLVNRREKELEADKFAGYIMQKFGSSLPKVQNTFHQITSNYDDTNSTHPNLNKRLKAIEHGYNLGERGIKSMDILNMIKGDSIKFSINLEKLKRKKLIEKIIISATYRPVSQISNKSILNIGSNARSYNQEKIETVSYFSLPFGSDIFLTELDIPKFQNKFYLEIKNEILFLKMKIDNREKIIYTSIFDESKISFREITSLFYEIYETIINKKIEETRR